MTVLYFLATIVLLVVIHECGHFATARFFGVGVRSFTVGFGKQFVSWVDPKTGTSWGIAPYPVGGYVGLLGEQTSQEEASMPTVTGKPFLDAPLHAKLCILVAGPLVNLVFAALLYALLAFSAPNPALPLLAKPPVGSAVAALGIQSGDEVSTINGETVRSWRDVQMALLQLSAGQAFSLDINGRSQTLEMPSLKRGESADALLGLYLFSNGLEVKKTVADSAAIQAGIQASDIMVSVNDVVIDHPLVLINALKGFTSDSPPLQISLIRSGQTISVVVNPLLNDQKSYQIGVQFSPLHKTSDQSGTVSQALQDGVSTAYTASALTIKAFGAFLLKPFQSDQLAGPITIAQTAKASADSGWMAALSFIAGLSISVGILNLLPVPMLDGGQIVFHTATRLFQGFGLRFKISTQSLANRWWSSLGISFVILLTLLAFWTDFKRLFDF
jgi:regulator of sigma E protease